MPTKQLKRYNVKVIHLNSIFACLRGLNGFVTVDAYSPDDAKSKVLQKEKRDGNKVKIVVVGRHDVD